MEKEIIYVFIDSQNLNLSVRDQGWRLDFRKFYIYLKNKYKIVKAFLFIGYVDKNVDLYQKLEKIGYILIFKPTIPCEKDRIKGNVDAELVLYSMIEFCNYDKAIIVSGDGDFYCLIKYLLSKNKLKNIIIPNMKKYSGLLKEFRKYSIFINVLKDKLGK